MRIGAGKAILVAAQPAVTKQVWLYLHIMNNALIFEILKMFALGGAISLPFYFWKSFSISWQNWFPPLRKLLQAILCIAILAIFYLALTSANEESIGTTTALIAFFAGTGGSLLFFRKRAPPLEVVERGAMLADVKSTAKSMLKAKVACDLQLGGLPIPREAEPYHMLITGSTGSGKSVAIRTLLDKIRSRGDSAIIVDSGGEFLARYWTPEIDLVINPFDERCAPWSPLAEVSGPWDAEALARSIIPDGTAESKEWNSYAQTFLSSCLQQLMLTGRSSLKDMLWAVQTASVAELKELLEGTPARPQLNSEKMFGSIRTIVSNYTASYNYLQTSETPFSVSEFVSQERGGFMYLTYREDQLDSLKNMISCVIDVACRAILSLEPEKTRRIWLVIDEFASIGKVQSVEAFATKSRKVGGCLVLGLQSVSQIRERYGQNSAQSILSCLSTWLVLRATDSETAEYLSKHLGESEVLRSIEGRSSGDTGANSDSWNQQKVVERLVLASEIQQLGNLSGFLKLAGEYPLCPVILAFPPQHDKKAEAFCRRKAPAAPRGPENRKSIAELSGVAANRKKEAIASQSRETPKDSEPSQISERATVAARAKILAHRRALPASRIEGPLKPGNGPTNAYASIPLAAAPKKKVRILSHRLVRAIGELADIASEARPPLRAQVKPAPQVEQQDLAPPANVERSAETFSVQKEKSLLPKESPSSQRGVRGRRRNRALASGFELGLLKKINSEPER